MAENAIDINIFQHKPYLDGFKAEHNLDLTEVFQVPTAPLGLYGGKLTALDQVKDGSTVSVPNDPSNLARALVMLKELGWIKLKDGIDPLKAAVSDIAENTRNIKLVEMEAANLPRSRQDVDFAIVNGNYAMSSGMKLSETLFQEPSFAYVNWAAVRTADKDSQWVKDVADAYNSTDASTAINTLPLGAKTPPAMPKPKPLPHRQHLPRNNIGLKKAACTWKTKVQAAFFVGYSGRKPTEKSVSPRSSSRSSTS